MQGRGWCHDNVRVEDDSCTPKTDCRQQGTKGSRLECVEQYEPGVYITLTVLSDGQKGLKRVRFSWKRFSDKEAQKWWEENQGRVYHKYDIDGYANSSQNQGKS
ncbi:Regulator of chromosome condensation (RCC1) family with FYVE zinc finger domain [Euphorbia peplus]|nr:Regulator of chromosome condensation (RCC1) family with FYVE zinc finger domain [Euphorbia peplus]